MVVMPLPIPVDFSRGLFRQMLYGLCDIYRYGAPTRDIYGGEVASAPTITANVPCQFAPYQGSALYGPETQQIREQMTVVFHLRHDQPIDINDVIRFDGVDYAVVWTPAVTGRDILRRVGVRLNQ